jgi:2-polyprenyl-3-methyl-5-hydroxy-6-metoxy-1,4-benzoquinol methylase
MTASFDRFARDYEAVLNASISFSGEPLEYFADYKARYVAMHSPAGFSGKILDFGCGIGLLSAFIKRRLPCAQVHGYDISAESIRRVSPALSDQGLFTSDAARLDRDYALVVLANVLHHIPPDHRTTLLRDVGGHMTRGGKLFIFEHNPGNPLTRRVVDCCPFDRGVTLLRPMETRHRIAGVGLRVLACDYIMFLPRPLSFLRVVEPRLARLPLGAQYAVIGEKHG